MTTSSVVLSSAFCQTFCQTSVVLSLGSRSHPPFFMLCVSFSESSYAEVFWLCDALFHYVCWYYVCLQIALILFCCEPVWIGVFVSDVITHSPSLSLSLWRHHTHLSLFMVTSIDRLIHVYLYCMHSHSIYLYLDFIFVLLYADDYQCDLLYTLSHWYATILLWLIYITHVTNLYYLILRYLPIYTHEFNLS